ncbi:helix-turn-helix domain-containing protein [Arthrobacter sp. KNU-44]|uniref:helix-turn-helix domain-containing protein n=1 Tax=Arthrobacter sp. KNU-44 TaxID=3450744 RepID=UPI003F41E74B
MNEDDELLTVTEVAQALRMDEHYVYRCINSGKLLATKHGNRYRIRRSDYQTFITPATKPVERPRTQRQNIKRLMKSA